MKVQINIKGKSRPVAVYGQEEPKPVITLGDAIDIYCANNYDNLAPSTIRGYMNVREKHFESIINVDIFEITDEMIDQAVKEERAKGYAKNTVNGYLRVVKKALKMREV